MSLYLLNVTIHVFAALFWLGGMFFLAVVGAPVLRAVEPPALRAQLFRRLGEKFRGLAWGAIGILVVTGTANLYFRGLLRMDVWTNMEFWGSGYGQALFWKLFAVLSMIVISAIHDFVVGPRAGKLQPGSPAAQVARKRASWLARANAILGIVLVIAAVRLARGG